MTFRKSDKQTLAVFTKNQQTGRIRNFSFDNKLIRLVESGMETPKENLIIFVHGAPGSSQDMLPFLYNTSLLKRARMISVDRLGYGYSDYGNAEVSIAKQAKMIAALVEEATEKNIVVVGHSFGGPIVAKSSLMSSKISKVMMLAPVNDPYNEIIFWVSNLGKWKLTRWMFSKAWKVAADEKFAHEAELLKMKDDWKRINVTTVHIHGHKDFLAPLSNVEWSKKNIPDEHLKLINEEELDHFIPFKNRDLVVKELLLLLD